MRFSSQTPRVTTPCQPPERHTQEPEYHINASKACVLCDCDKICSRWSKKKFGQESPFPRGVLAVATQIVRLCDFGKLVDGQKKIQSTHVPSPVELDDHRVHVTTPTCLVRCLTRHNVQSRGCDIQGCFSKTKPTTHTATHPTVSSPKDLDHQSSHNLDAAWSRGGHAWSRGGHSRVARSTRLVFGNSPKLGLRARLHPNLGRVHASTQIRKDC